MSTYWFTFSVNENKSFIELGDIIINQLSNSIHFKISESSNFRIYKLNAPLRNNINLNINNWTQVPHTEKLSPTKGYWLSFKLNPCSK